MKVGYDDVVAARKKIEGSIQVTPVNSSRSVSERLGTQVYLKLENQQTTGSYKIRGSLNKMLSLSQEELRKGIVACSAGNHAQGVAFAASKVGAKSYIVMPETAPLAKVLATRAYGAEVIQHGRVFDDSYQYALELEKKHGYTFVHPFEDPLIIAGQGTVGLEILEQIPDVDSIVMPIGGGGLISGVAIAVKKYRPNVKIYGVVSAVSPGMKQLFKKESLEAPSTALTIADGISVKKAFRSHVSRVHFEIRRGYRRGCRRGNCRKYCLLFGACQNHGRRFGRRCAMRS